MAAPVHQRPARLRLTLDCRRAAMVAGAGVAFGLVSFVFAARPLLVAGVALCAIGALTPLWVLASARGARARRILSVDRVTEGTVLHVTIEVHRSFAAGGWGRLEILDELTGRRLALGGAASPLRSVRDASVQLSAPMGRRGEYVLAPPTITARDPLDLARAESPGRDAPQVMLVLPRTEPVQWTTKGRIRRSDGEDGRIGAEALAAADLDGLRPYRPGSPASRIHWLALACGRGLIERRLRADGDERPLVVLDTRTRTAAHRAPEEPVDAAVARPPRSCSSSRVAAAARYCCPVSRARRSSTPSCRPGRPSTPAWRSSAPRPIRIAPGRLRSSGSPAGSRSSMSAPPRMSASERRSASGPAARSCSSSRPPSWSTAARAGWPGPPRRCCR